MCVSAKRRHGWFLMGLTTVAGTVGYVAVAGNTNPPAGPVASTFKTLSEIEPRVGLRGDPASPQAVDAVLVISTPGSYYLTGSFQSTAGRSAIKITADNVTLDLSGFAITGVAGALEGISVPGVVRSLTIRNGVIRSFPGSGIFAGNAVGARFEDLHLANNSLDGLWPGDDAIISRVRAHEHGRHGFNLGARNGILMVDCLAEGNQVGYEGGQATQVAYRNCIARSNRAEGFRTSNSQLEGCIADGNVSHGFLSIDRVVYRGCAANSNTARGFSLGFDNAVVNCSAVGNGGWGIGEPSVSNIRVIGSTASVNGGGGIYLGGEATVIDSAAVDNSGSSDGIRVGYQSVVRTVVAKGNPGRGIVAAGRTTIQDSTASGNSGVGVQFTDRNSTIRGTIASNNSGGGILGASPLGGFLLESNTVSDNTGIGISVGVGSRVVGNVVRGNSLDGILVDSGCHVTGNHVDVNGTAAGTQGGVRALNGNNTIADNFLAGNDFNIVASPACCTTIVRNVSTAPVSGHIQTNGGGFIGTLTINPATLGTAGNIQQ